MNKHFHNIALFILCINCYPIINNIFSDPHYKFGYVGIILFLVMALFSIDKNPSYRKTALLLLLPASILSLALQIENLQYLCCILYFVFSMKHKYWLIASIFGIAILPISSFWINSLLDSSTANLARAAIYISISATIIYQKKQRTLPLFTSIGSLKNHRLSILFTLLILLTMKLVDISVNKIYSAQNWNENLLIEKEHKHLLENGFIPIERELDSAYAGSKKYLKIENKQITYKFLVCSKDIVGGFHDPIYCLTASGFDVVKSHLTKKNGHTENQIIARSEGKKSLFQYYYQTINEKHPNLFWAKFQERIYNFSFGMIGSPVIMILTEIK